MSLTEQAKQLMSKDLLPFQALGAATVRPRTALQSGRDIARLGCTEHAEPQ